MPLLFHHDALMTMPIALVLLALLVIAAWFFQRQHTYLLWLAVSLLILDAAFALKDKDQTWSSDWGAVYLFGGAAWALAQAMAQRHGQQIKVQWVALCTVLAGGGAWLLSAQVYLAVVVLALAGVLGHVLPRIWASTPRHKADRFLRFFYTVIVLLVAAAPWLFKKEWDAEGRVSTLALLCTVVLVLSMLACPFCDSWLRMRSRQRRDGLTGLLSRAGFDATCSSLPAEQNISVVVVCELDNYLQRQREFGAHSGGVVVSQFAVLLQSAARAHDVAARLSAGTFALALREADFTYAQAVVEKMRAAARQVIWAAKNTQEPVTASYAIVSVRKEDSLEAIMHRADVLLLQAREDGTNCIELDHFLHVETPVARGYSQLQNR